MNEKKTEKDLSILDSQDIEIEEVKESATEEVANPDGTIEEVVKSETLSTNEEDGEVIPEKKKIKPWILIASVALILAIIAVGVYTWYDYNTLASYDGGRITRDEYNKKLEVIYLANGITEDILNDSSNAEAVQEFNDGLLVSMATEEVIYKQFENLNIGQLEEDEINALEEEATTNLQDYIEGNIDEIISTLPEGYSDKDLEKAKEEFGDDALRESGFIDFDDYKNTILLEESFNRAYDELIPEEEIAPTDEEVRAEYDKLLDSQKEAYDASPSDYLDTDSSSDMQLYVPSGIRKVRHVLFLIDNETLTEIQTLSSEGNEEEAEKKYEEALEGIRPEAEEVLAKLDAGELTFKEAIDEYNDDSAQESYPEGYAVCEGYDSYVQEFIDGCMSLTEVGQYSGLVSSSYGYHIIEYYSDVPSSITPYEDVKEEITTSLLATNKSNRWLELLEQWPKDLNLKFKNEELSEMSIY